MTIYEKHTYLGGILRHGIPRFRLEEDVVKSAIKRILTLGIEAKYEQELGKNITIEELEEEYDAIFLSIGANISSKMRIEGEELEGVYGGNELLEKGIHPNYTGKKVAIIGGGNVAMDTARTVKGMGAEEVYILYRRAEEQMPAEKKEIEDARQEGIAFLFQTNIVRILGEEKVEGVECIKTELIQKEGEARAVPVDIEGSNYEIPMDYVMMAVGSMPEKKIIDTLPFDKTERGYITVKENYETSRENVFAGGDLAGTKATVAWAAKSRKRSGEGNRREIDWQFVGDL